MKTRRASFRLFRMHGLCPFGTGLRTGFMFALASYLRSLLRSLLNLLLAPGLTAWPTYWHVRGVKGRAAEESERDDMQVWFITSDSLTDVNFS